MLDVLEKRNYRPHFCRALRGRIAYMEEDYESARLQLDEAIRMSPLNAPAHNLDGSLLRRKGRFKEAQRAYAKAIKIDPDYAPAHYNIAVLFDIYLQYWFLDPGAVFGWSATTGVRASVP